MELATPRQPALPIVDIAPLIAGGDTSGLAEALRRACTEDGFFYVVGHGVDPSLVARLDALSRRFFAQKVETKLDIRMALAGRAWRGYFPVGDELTSGAPDVKEGLYFGAELGEEHPKVRANVPLFGRNLFPPIAGFREAVLDYMDAMTRLGHRIVAGLALSLGLDADYFADRYTRDPFILFRIFHYPPIGAASEPNAWGVGEHTDYGLLTMLRQDMTGGLEVKSQSRWIEVPPIEGAFVCNLGDMLDRMTGGLYRSTPHRVRQPAGLTGRLSFPFFFDPNFDAKIEPITPNVLVADDKNERWDRASVHEFQGTHGEYLLKKIAKVFPQLASDLPTGRKP